MVPILSGSVSVFAAPVQRILTAHVSSTIAFLSKRCASSVVKQAEFGDYKLENEPVLDYAKGSKERKELEDALQKHSATCEDIPIVIGTEEIRTEKPRFQVMPFDHKKQIAKYYHASKDLVKKAIDSSLAAQKDWEHVPVKEKMDIFLRAADLISGKYRKDMNSTTMLGQAKTAIQAEIDAAAELCDFLRFNVYFAKELHKYQPISTQPEITKNSLRFRGLEGFVASISPFNFTAIGGNLAYAPTYMGSVVLWKPSDTAMLSNYTIFKILREAGFPPGVVNFVPADGPVFGDTITASPHLAGINFTGSVPTFQRLWTQVGKNISSYHSFPRLVGETGGKNYHFIHPSANLDTAVTATIMSAFEYCGQKCSACSRAFVPESIWPKVKEGLLEIRSQLKMGSPLDFTNFISSVIDDASFKRISKYIDRAKNTPALEILGGGVVDKSVGYFIEPTIVESKDPMDSIMREEIFGPVLSIYVYRDKEVDKTLDILKTSTPFGLTGAVIAEDQDFLNMAFDSLKSTAGNFYINDKSTGAIVGQQPFGGARVSGTNDKAGGPHYLLRFASAQAVKETFVPITDWKYPHMEA